MKKIAFLVLIFITTLFFAQSGFSQSKEEFNALKEDIKALKDGQRKLQKEVQEIKSLLRAKAPPEFKEAVVSIKGDPFKGDKNAKLGLIEFSDYQCPFCARHVRETVPQIEKDFVETGKLRYYFLDFPLGFHKQAFKAAEAAECADEQGKFWQMHDRLFENQKALNPDDLLKYAEAIGLDMQKFKECLDNETQKDEIQKDLDEGQKAGVTGTPTSLLGWVEPDGKSVRAVKIVKGAQPYSAFKEAIEGLLNAQKK